jgi:homoserine acetyltransferase
LKENTSEKRSTNAFLADFYRKSSSIQEFSSRRVPYHYEEAGMYKELLTYLRSQESRFVNRLERQAYIYVRLYMKYYN